MFFLLAFDMYRYMFVFGMFMVTILDLRLAGVDCVTLGQYMQPTKLHMKVCLCLFVYIDIFLSISVGAQLESNPATNYGACQQHLSLLYFSCNYFQNGVVANFLHPMAIKFSCIVQDVLGCKYN